MLVREWIVTPISYLRSRFLDSALTALGIITCITLTIVLIGFVREFSTGVYRNGFDSLATSFSITKSQPHATAARGIQSLSDSDVLALRRDLDPSLVSHVIPIVSGGAILSNHGHEYRGTITGGSSDYLAYQHVPLVAGAMFTEEQVNNSARVVLIAPGIVKNLFGGDNAAALGADIMVGRLKFQVIGLIGKNANDGGNSATVAPYTTVRNSLLGGIQTVSSIGIVTTSAAAMDRASDQATAILENRHTPKKTGLEDDFDTSKLTSARPVIARQLGITLLWFALAVAVLAALIGSAGLSTIMLRAVREHTREIRVHRIAGVSRGHMVRKCLTESMIISGLFGLIGVGAGVTVALIGQSRLASIAPQLGAPQLLSEAALAAGFGLSLLVGLIAGAYPAIQAARIQLPDALR
jgi:putative ABC transport system permease protein